MITAILFVSFFAMLLIGMPIAICLGMSSVLTILYASNFVRKFANLTLSVVATNTYTGISKFLLLAIPFFVLSGNIMAKAGISLWRDLRVRAGHGGSPGCCAYSGDGRIRV